MVDLSNTLSHVIISEVSVKMALQFLCRVIFDWCNLSVAFSQGMYNPIMSVQRKLHNHILAWTLKWTLSFPFIPGPWDSSLVHGKDIQA